MNELKNEIRRTVSKEAAKEWLKQQMTLPYDSIQRRYEIDQIVEQAAQYADFIENTARIYGVDLEQFVYQLFGLK